MSKDTARRQLAIIQDADREGEQVRVEREEDVSSNAGAFLDDLTDDA